MQTVTITNTALFELHLLITYTLFIFPITFRIHDRIYFRALVATDVWYLIANLCSYQLEQEILDFSQGLRAIGVAPDEKLALFADNSCRWLVADQGNIPFLF
jgi:hypothetical protein